jgi:hypothetical protein
MVAMPQFQISELVTGGVDQKPGDPVPVTIGDPQLRTGVWVFLAQAPNRIVGSPHPRMALQARPVRRANAGSSGRASSARTPCSAGRASQGDARFDGARFVGNSWFDETSFGSDA